MCVRLYSGPLPWSHNGLGTVDGRHGMDGWMSNDVHQSSHRWHPACSNLSVLTSAWHPSHRGWTAARGLNRFTASHGCRRWLICPVPPLPLHPPPIGASHPSSPSPSHRDAVAYNGPRRREGRAAGFPLPYLSCSPPMDPGRTRYTVCMGVRIAHLAVHEGQRDGPSRLATCTHRDLLSAQLCCRALNIRSPEPPAAGQASALVPGNVRYLDTSSPAPLHFHP